MNCEKTKPAVAPSTVEPDTTPTMSEFISALEDPDMRKYLKSSLGITDEQLKAHVQRLIDATMVEPKPGKK